MVKKIQGKIIFIFFLISQGCSTVSYPTFDPLPFDQAEYDQLRKKGTGIVQGSVYARAADGTLLTGQGNVILMPVTRYTTLRFNEQVIGGKLASRNEDPRYSKYVFEVKPDKNGRFLFKDIPAGEYYIVSNISWVQSGNNYGGNTYLKINVKDQAVLDVFLEFNNERVAKKYKDTAAEELLMKIDSLGGFQGKYESDIEFFNRVSNISPFNICSKMNDYDIKFDKKTGNIKLSHNLYKEQFFGKTYYSLPVYRKITSKGIFSGQNSYGAKFDFEKFDIDNLYLGISNHKAGSYEFPTLEVDLPDTAKSDLSKGKSIYLCLNALPIEPYFFEKFSFTQATSINLRESDVNIKYIFVDLDFFSAVSEEGEVYNNGKIVN